MWTNWAIVIITLLSVFIMHTHPLAIVMVVITVTTTPQSIKFSLLSWLFLSLSLLGTTTHFTYYCHLNHHFQLMQHHNWLLHLSYIQTTVFFMTSLWFFTFCYFFLWIHPPLIKFMWSNFYLDFIVKFCTALENGCHCLKNCRWRLNMGGFMGSTYFN